MKLKEMRAEIARMLGGKHVGTSGPSTAKTVIVYDEGWRVIRGFNSSGTDRQALERVLEELRKGATDGR